VLKLPVDKRPKELVQEVADQREMSIVAMEVMMSDHVHLFLKTDPRWAPPEIAGEFKAVTSRILREEFRQLRTGLPTLWSRPYSAATVGAVSEAAIRRYIIAQKTRLRSSVSLARSR
jgi:putative transposase